MYQSSRQATVQTSHAPHWQLRSDGSIPPKLFADCRRYIFLSQTRSHRDHRAYRTQWGLSACSQLLGVARIRIRIFYNIRAYNCLWKLFHSEVFSASATTFYISKMWHLTYEQSITYVVGTENANFGIQVTITGMNISNVYRVMIRASSLLQCVSSSPENGTFAAGDKKSQLFFPWDMSHNALPKALKATRKFSRRRRPKRLTGEYSHHIFAKKTNRNLSILSHLNPRSSHLQYKKLS